MKNSIVQFLCLLLFWATSPLLAQQAVELLGSLPAEVPESSGLIFYNGHLITHNDSGNEPLLYEVDTTSLQVVRKVRVVNAVNTDWEDLAQDDSFIYVGDIGNNAGNRASLTIYKVSKQDFDASEAVVAEVISFVYEDQVDLNPGPNSDWDAEALLAAGGQLLVFTKQWQSLGSKAYSLPTTPGTYQARLLGSFAANGLVTGASYREGDGVAYLCGYTQILRPFLIRMDHFDPGQPFAGSPQFILLDTGLAQIEGIAESAAGRYFLSSERFTRTNPPIELTASLYVFQRNDATREPRDEPPTDGGPDKSELKIIAPFGSRSVFYELNREEPVYGRAIFDLQGRRIRYTASPDFDGNNIDLATLGSAIYYLTFYLDGKTISKPFFLK